MVSHDPSEVRSCSLWGVFVYSVVEYVHVVFILMWRGVRRQTTKYVYCRYCMPMYSHFL